MSEIRLGDKGEVLCEGRLDASQAGKAEAFLDALAAPDVVDMARLEYTPSAGSGVLLRTQKRLLQSGGGLRLVNPSRHIRDIFRYSGFDRIFQIDDGA